MISNTHESLSARLRMTDQTPYPAETCPVPLHDFRAVSLEEVRGFASKSSGRYSNLDPPPASVVKGCLDTLLPVIIQIVNLSLTKGAISWLNCFLR